MTALRCSRLLRELTGTSSGSSAIWLEKIGAGKTADISIDLNAKADLLQKPYSIDVSMKYEDDGNAQIDSFSFFPSSIASMDACAPESTFPTNTSSFSILSPVI